MRRAVRQIAVLAGGLILVCVLCRFVFFRDYTVYVPIHPGADKMLRQENIEAAVRENGAFSLEEATFNDRYVALRIHPETPGTSFMVFQADNEDFLVMEGFRVGRFDTVYDLRTGGFNGDSVVMIAVTIFWLAVSGIMIWRFFQAKGSAFYAYSSVYYAGFSLFALVTGAVMASVTTGHLIKPVDYSMMGIYSTINRASISFMELSAPLMLLFALVMAVSNIVLLCREGKNPANMLGLLASLLLIGGEVLGWYLFNRDYSGSEWEIRIRSALENTYATVFVYFECMLIGSMACGIRAAAHEPERDKDFVLILGCWFRKDGTLPPLLRDRADRAIAFWRKEREETGREAWLIPSGGQGEDEPMPEAEAIRRYLAGERMPEEKILVEDRSRSTLQNMAYSLQLIRATKPEGRAVFATSDYHVFRSGIWANEAGLKAEGIGSRTRWWFWPNAFIRETIGLLQKRWKQEILLLVLLIAFFLALAAVLN